ncbi:MAG: NVEALA domain-containing protein [Bacteroidales bacterium]|jgi:hypothetical protein|nr:NVEALA domain-containing protein [Bacteroidales bacterium]
MKKKIFGLMAIAVMAAVAAWNVSQNRNEMALSDVALANIEALGQEINPLCPNGCLVPEGFCICYGWHPHEEAFNVWQ